MYTLPFFRKILNLNWKKVKIFGIYEQSKKIIFKIRGKYNNTTCPHCGFDTNKKQDKKLHKQNKLVNHMPYGGDKMIFLELYKRYFRCTNCNTQFYEKFDFESPNGIYTNHFEQYIQWNWGHVSGNKLAELYQSSASVIYSILERIDVNLINEKGIEIIKNLDEVWLGVDEKNMCQILFKRITNLDYFLCLKFPLEKIEPKSFYFLLKFSIITEIFSNKKVDTRLF